MEAYPPEYIEHNLPLVLLSGLGEQSGVQTEPKTPRQESGTRIVTASKECQGDRAAQLLEQFQRRDGSQQPWNSAALPGPTGSLRYKIKPIGRTYSLPPRKAAPLPQSPGAEQNTVHRNVELHSPLSPSSPGSPIYGDGILTPLWFAKHQQQVPSLLLAFFEISGNDSTAQNEQIQIDINAIRTAVGRSGFKTRFAVVLISDKSILHAPELEDRLSEIRRATTLDPKHGLFFMPPMSSQAEIATFVQTLLTTLQPLIVEHYRDLTKHARRKKGRGAPPPSVASPVGGSSHSLPTSGWNVRYETKQGVFAEFRQEMDVAERHYSAAIEELFQPDGIFETTPSWSRRWDEARLLCDALALRAIRCELWMGLTSSAVLSWVNYRVSMKDLVDRRGKGSQTYSWDAWEARWAEIMAQLIYRAELPTFHSSPRKAVDDSGELALLQIYAPPEKAASTTDRLPPFQFLHHPGYWLRLAVDSARARKEKALAIPEEDRTPPGQSPASVVAQRAKSYDTFLVPGPHDESPLTGRDGYDHIADIRRLTLAAVEEFAARGQMRSSERLRLNLAMELAGSGQHKEALGVILPVWTESSWRDDNWNKLFEQILVTTHECASHAGQGEVLLVSAWELLRNCADTTPLAQLDLAEYLKKHGFDSERKVSASLEDRQKLSPISLSFAFSDRETHVGEPLECQLLLASLAARDSAPIALSRIEIVLSSGKSLSITHAADEHKASQKEKLVDLSGVSEDTTGSLSLRADLALMSGHTRVFSFCLTFREAQEVKVERATVSVEADNLVLEHAFTDGDLLRSRSLAFENKGVLERRNLPHSDSLIVNILPKPPKMQVALHGLHEQYYTNEPVQLRVELLNEEAEDIEAKAQVRIPNQSDADLTVRWGGEDGSASELEVGKIPTAASHELRLLIAAPSEPRNCSVAIELRYTLASDPNTALTKTVTLDLEVVAPLEAKYGFGPLLHADPWPSFFNAEALSNNEEPAGILHRWRLGAQINLVATEKLVIKKIALVENEVADDARCTIHGTITADVHHIETEKPTDWAAELVTQKFSLDDRRPTLLDLSLEVTWAREEGAAEVTTSLSVPRLTLPSSEPRVLCTTSGSSSQPEGIALHYHLENPSLHFLTFALTMEANDEFAFSGPKYRTLSVAPLSRLRIDYRLLVHDQDAAHGEAVGGRWIWPVLQVVDSYYHKNLKVHAGGPGVRYEEKRGLSVLVSGME